MRSVSGLLLCLGVLSVAGAAEGTAPDYAQFAVLREVGIQPGGGGAAFSPDGRKLLTCGLTLNLWDVEKGILIRCFGRDRSCHWLSHPAFTPDGTLVLAVSSSKLGVCIWDTESGNLLRVVQTGGKDLALSPDGSTFLSNGSLWDVKTGAKIREFGPNADYGIRSAVVFTADSKKCFSFGPECPFTQWDVATGKSIASARVFHRETRHTAIAPEGKAFLMSDSQGFVILFDSAGKKMREWSRDQQPLGAPRTFFYTPDGKGVVWQGADSIQMLDAATWQPVTKIEGIRPYLIARAVSTDGKRIVATDEYHCWAVVWDVPSGEKVAEFAGHACSPHCLAFAPDGKTFLSGDLNQAGKSDSPIIQWSVAEGRVHAAFWDPSEKNPACSAVELTFTPDGRRFFSCAGYAKAMLWDARTGEVVRTYLHPNKSFAIRGTLSPDGKTVVLCGKGTVFYASDTGEEVQSLPETAGRFVCYAPDGMTFVLHRRQLARGGMEDTLAIHDSANWKETKTVKTSLRNGVRGAAFHPGGEVLAITDSSQRVSLWDIEKGKLLKPIEVASRGGSASACAFSPDGKVLATGVSENREQHIALWNWPAGTRLKEIRGTAELPMGVVGRLAFSPDGGTLLAATGTHILVIGGK